MRVRFAGEETYHLTDMTEIKKWWQSPSYKQLNTDNIVTPDTPIDPLAGK